MTYLTLLEQLQRLPQEQLDNTITVYDKEIDEFFPVVDFQILDETDLTDPANGVLDDQHPYLVME